MVRAWICVGLEFLGVELDEKRNAAGEGVISMKDSRITVRVIATNEELMIAQLVRQVLDITDQEEK